MDSKALFTDDCGNPLRSETLSNEYKEFLDSHSDEIRYLNFHALRHTFATHFMMNGGNIITLQKILGHSKIEQTMNYAHFAPDFLQDAISYNPLQGKADV